MRNELADSQFDDRRNAINSSYSDRQRHKGKLRLPARPVKLQGEKVCGSCHLVTPDWRKSCVHCSRTL